VKSGWGEKVIKEQGVFETGSRKAVVAPRLTTACVPSSGGTIRVGGKRRRCEQKEGKPINWFQGFQKRKGSRGERQPKGDREEGMGHGIVRECIRAMGWCQTAVHQKTMKKPPRDGRQG